MKSIKLTTSNVKERLGAEKEVGSFMRNEVNT